MSINNGKRKHKRPDGYSYLMVLGVVEDVGTRMYPNRYKVQCLPQDITHIMSKILYENLATPYELNVILCAYEDLIFTGCIGGEIT